VTNQEYPAELADETVPYGILDLRA